MNVSLLSKGGRYEVQSASGNRCEVDVDELLAIDAALARWLPVALSVGCEPPYRTDAERQPKVASVGYAPTARDNRQTALVRGSSNTASAGGWGVK